MNSLHKLTYSQIIFILMLCDAYFIEDIVITFYVLFCWLRATHIVHIWNHLTFSKVAISDINRPCAPAAISSFQKVYIIDYRSIRWCMSLIQVSNKSPHKQGSCCIGQLKVHCPSLVTHSYWQSVRCVYQSSFGAVLLVLAIPSIYDKLSILSIAEHPFNLCQRWNILCKNPVTHTVDFSKRGACK